MRALKLDLVHRPGALHIAGVCLLTVAVAATVYLGQLYFEHVGTAETWEVKWQSLQTAARHKRSGPAQKQALEQLDSELKLASAIIGRLSMPWDDLFYEVEMAVDEQVSLLNVEPDTEKRELRITAEAKNLMAMLEYQKRLSTSELFRNVHVTSHQIQQQDPQKPVRFVVNAQWLEHGAVLPKATDAGAADQAGL